MTDTLVVWEAFEKDGFFSKMRQKLKLRETRNTDHPDPRNIPIIKLLKHLQTEVNELEMASTLDNFQEELADIANLCGFLYINAEKRDGILCNKKQ